MTSSAELPCYTLLYSQNDSESPSELILRKELESNDTKAKIRALKKIINLILSGERLPNLLMVIMRFVMPSQDHKIKKLLLLYWEIVPKTTPDGKLLHEMILVCDAYRKDLQHPNEYVRGSTLRFLCKLKEAELLEPLMPTIRSCLEHRHAYVRRNAVMAIYTIFRNFDYLIPDAPELVHDFLEREQDASCKRNAFMMLIHVDQDRALEYLSSCIDQVGSFGDILQLIIVELVYKVCHSNPSQRTRFIRCIYNLLNSNSAAVRYEAAGTLVTLSSAPTAVRAAASCYIELIVKESDNNVKLIVLEKLNSLRKNPNYVKIIQELTMDILRVLNAPDMEVRKKTLQLIMDLITPKTIEEVVGMLKKEITKTMNATEKEDAAKYRHLLVRTLHTCSIKYPEVAESVIPLLVEFLGDGDEVAGNDVLVFMREAMQKFQHIKPLVMNMLLDSFQVIRTPSVHRAAIWLLGEYCDTQEECESVMNEIKKGLGDVPLVDSELKMATDSDVSESETKETAQQSSGQNLVTADGSYATQAAISALSSKKELRPRLREYLMDGEFFVGATMATTLTKLTLRYSKLCEDTARKNRFSASAMLYMAGILHLGKSGLPKKAINDDDFDRISVCISVLSTPSDLMMDIFTKECRKSLSEMIANQSDSKEDKPEDLDEVVVRVQADDPISFMSIIAPSEDDLGENQFEESLSKALTSTTTKKDNPLDSQLNKVHQLTGFSDPVYAEAYIYVNQYDIVLDVLIVNQTGDTLQNTTLELATLGDLKLVEKPVPITIAPRDFCNIKANIKVASTENGIIFGNIVYDVSGTAHDRNCVVLNEIHIDIMDYIMPATCTDTEFRQMWAEFEWENKVTVNSNITDIQEYLDHIIASTNMKCLTSDTALKGDCGFLAANLYAKSIFGEDALANVSIERTADQSETPVTGHIRIRAKSQGMALSLGDKINLSQKKSS
ncbi:Coatomer subunit beta [Trichoplax sp. H2]|nr:Coatomer subunit beta [Trichoplax sp. H2]|eukprot:RDD39708.1 Coatomer subunit beta [Trichoplax sp. H2]